MGIGQWVVVCGDAGLKGNLDDKKGRNGTLEEGCLLCKRSGEPQAVGAEPGNNQIRSIRPICAVVPSHRRGPLRVWTLRRDWCCMKGGAWRRRRRLVNRRAGTTNQKKHAAEDVHSGASIQVVGRSIEGSRQSKAAVKPRKLTIQGESSIQGSCQAKKAVDPRKLWMEEVDDSRNLSIHGSCRPREADNPNNLPIHGGCKPEQLVNPSRPLTPGKLLIQLNCQVK